MQPDDDEAWRSIVDNYGDRAELDPDPDPPAAAREPSVVDEPSRQDEHGPWSSPDRDWTTDRFVPPEPPPLPATSRDRWFAWVGLFGAPVALLVLLVLGIGVPSWVPLLLVAAFVGGFVYLVVQMPREPRDPDDDGAVL